MRTILIDPYAMTVAELDLPDLSHRAMAQVIGAPYLDRSSLGGGVSAFVDDEGLMRSGQRFWHFENSPVLMAGKALIVSLDAQGEPGPLAPFATVAITQNMVAFLGDAHGAERAIEKGLIQRPMNVVFGFDGETQREPEIIWQWDHRDCLDEETTEGK